MVVNVINCGIKSLKIPSTSSPTQLSRVHSSSRFLLFRLSPFILLYSTRFSPCSSFVDLRLLGFFCTVICLFSRPVSEVSCFVHGSLSYFEPIVWSKTHRLQWRSSGTLSERAISASSQLDIVSLHQGTPLITMPIYNVSPKAVPRWQDAG